MVADTDVAAKIEAPPRNTVGPIAWIRSNLLSSWSNALLTVIGLYLAYAGRKHADPLGIDLGDVHGRRRQRLHPRRRRRLLAFHHRQVRPIHVWPLPRARALARRPRLLARAGRARTPDDPPRTGQVLECPLRVRDLPDYRFFPAGGRRFRAPACRYGAVGRPARHLGRRHRRHRRLVPARHSTGPGPALEDADRALGIGRLHRVRPRRAADHGAVHGLGDVAAVPAARRDV